MNKPTSTIPFNYNLPYWSDGYVDINPDGDVVIRPHRGHDQLAVNLKQLVERLQSEGLQLPLLIRFNTILHDRVNSLVDAFNQVNKVQGYQGQYKVVYPIKVNQQRRVVEEIIAAEPAASNGQVGLEAGSKPELMAVLALSPQPDATIICNGYKDREYIRLALIGRKLGRKIYIVVEKHSELEIILDEAAKLGVTPLIGLRARLSTIGKGNWQNTGGEKSKFGLSASQILKAVETLDSHQALGTLQLLHFHLGSQIANIRDIQTGLKECARFYSQLRSLGAPIDTVDIGGGLGIDYEGTRSRNACSVNYSLGEYAYNVVHIFQEESEKHDLPHPDIISESGRALTAHHAVLVTNVIGMESREDTSFTEPADDAPSELRTLWDDYQILIHKNSRRSLIEIYHDVALAMSDLNQLFAHGFLSLTDRAQAETIYMACCRLIRDSLSTENRVHREVIDELNEKLADKIFVNFSLFQSLPDIWGIDQIFPILPLQNLHKTEQRRVLIQDITCDSDGRIDQYVDTHGLETTLPLPAFSSHEELMLGFFLVGAYQEILGDMHNLFGDTDSVDVSVDDRGELTINTPIRGDSVDKVLRYVHYDPERLKSAYAQHLEAAQLPAEEAQLYLEELVQGLSGYTYLE